MAHARRRRGLQEAETRRGAGSSPGPSTPTGWTWSLGGRGRPSRLRGPDSLRFRLHILPLLSHRPAAVGAWSGRGGGAHQPPDRRLAAAVFVSTFLAAELRCEVTAIYEPALRVDALCFASEALTSPRRVRALHQQEFPEIIWVYILFSIGGRWRLCLPPHKCFASNLNDYFSQKCYIFSPPGAHSLIFHDRS